MKEYKFKTFFAAEISPINDDKKAKLISFASKNSNISKLLPKDINLIDNIGFQTFCGEAFCVNKLNLNADGVKTAEGIKLKNNIPLGFIDLNHNRKHLVGVVIDSNYIDYKTGKELTEEEVSKMTDPFSVVITGIIWRAPHPELAEAVQNINSEDSEFKDKIFLSWEVAFDKYDLMVIDKDKYNFSEGKLITDESEIDKLSTKLLSYGGNGLTDDGKKIGRVPIDDVVALGVGLVENPAGQVTPIVSEDAKEESKAFNVEDIKSIILDILKDNSIIAHEHKTVNCSCGKNISNCRCSSPDKKVEIIDKGCKDCQINENNISQAENTNVMTDNYYNNLPMKIEKIEQLTDENLKTIKASEIQELFASSNKQLVEEGIKKISEDFSAKVTEKENAIKAATENAEKLNNTVKDLETKLAQINDSYNKIIEANTQRDAVEAFSARMEAIESQFDLDEKQKEIVANKIKTINSDEDFNKYLAEVDILLAAKKKAPKNAKDDNKDEKNAGDDKDDADKKKNEAKASLDEALKNGTPDPKNVLPNTGASTETLKEKSKRVFGIEGWKINDVNSKRKNRI